MSTRNILTTLIISLAALALLSGCSRELRTADEPREQPFPFDRIPALGPGPSQGADEVQGQQSAGEQEPAVETAQPEVAEDEAPVAEDPEIARFMDAGRQALREGRYEEAIEQFQQVFARDRSNVRALYNIGYAYRQLGSWDSAIEFAKKAIEADPTMLGVHQNLGYAYEGKGDLDSAIFEFEEELRRHPDEPKLAGIAEKLARIYLDRDLHQEAFDAANQAVNLNPDEPAYHVTLAEAHISNGAYEQAISALEKACNLDPEDALLRKRLADALWDAGRQDEARQVYGEALALEPGLADSIPPARLPQDTSSADENPLDEPL